MLTPRSSRSNVKHACAALFVVLIAVVPLANAIPTFGIFVGPGNGGTPGNCTGSHINRSESSSSALSGDMACSDFRGATAGLAAAKPGQLGTSASATHSGNSSTFSMFAAANMIDTVIFSGPVGSSVTQIPVVLNLAFMGILDNAGTAMSSIILQVSLGSPIEQANIILSNTDLFCYGNNLALPVAFGGFNCSTASLNAGQILSLPVQQVSVGTPVVFSLQLMSGAHAIGNGSALSDFSNSLEFPTGIDVFTLPQGFTANAGSYLVNNRFTLAAIPEPETYVLMVAGLALLAYMQRRRKK